MKIAAYNYRPDELECFRRSAEDLGVELVLQEGIPSEETLEAARGCPSISVITSPIGGSLMRRFYEVGVRFISTRSIGYDHIDIGTAKEIGMHIGNVSYPADSVADYAVMLILMATRKLKPIMMRSAAQNFSLAGGQGAVLHNLTVGIVGAGRIGRLTAQRLSAFGCRILACDLRENDELKRYGEFVSPERLYAESDVITLHIPADRENYHLIGREELARMKNGVILVNTARGSLIDTEALLGALESGKVGGAALDVVENEAGLYYNNLENQVLPNRELAALKSCPNVIVTPHTAFYTDETVREMVRNSLKSCLLFQQGQPNPWQVL